MPTRAESTLAILKSFSISQLTPTYQAIVLRDFVSPVGIAMKLRPECVCCVLAFLSVSAVAPLEPADSPVQLWQKAQQALEQGRAEQAIELYTQSLAADGKLTRNHLGLAAAHLEKGDEAAACSHLATYVAAHPDNLEARSQYAELLVRQKRYSEARGQLERFVADAQDRAGDWLRPMIEARSRLVELAEITHDAYEEHLQRGIGFYLLARRQAKLGEGRGGLTSEGLLCKAAGELTSARDFRPQEARPSWYLYLVWRLLAQQHLAQPALDAALAAAPFTPLCAAEQRSLLLAEMAHKPRPPVRRLPRNTL